MNKTKEMLKIAEIHIKRIEQAVHHVGDMFPLNAENIENLSEENFAWIELLINRFGKLQDYMGTKLFEEFFALKKEIVDHLTMIDKLNRLECLGIIMNVDTWNEIREIRNYLTHEYPDHPELTAKYLNQIYLLIPRLLQIFNTLKERMTTKESH